MAHVREKKAAPAALFCTNTPFSLGSLDKCGHLDARLLACSTPLALLYVWGGQLPHKQDPPRLRYAYAHLSSFEPTTSRQRSSALTPKRPDNARLLKQHRLWSEPVLAYSLTHPFQLSTPYTHPRPCC